MEVINGKHSKRNLEMKINVKNITYQESYEFATIYDLFFYIFYD